MNIRSVALALLSLGWLAGAAGAAERSPISPPTLEEYSRLGIAIEALRTGDWHTAVLGFRSWAGHPSVLSDYVQFFLAESLSRAGDLAGARQAAESLAEHDSASRLAPPALLVAAHLASREGDEAGAERLLSKFLSRFPSNPEAARVRYLLGLTLEAQGRYAEAASTFRELWLFVPASAYGEAAADQLALLAGRGVVLPTAIYEEQLERAERLLASGALMEAREEAEVLLSEKADTELTFRTLGVLAESLSRLGRHGEAARAAERALALAPPQRRSSLLLELGRLQYRGGARDLALGSLNRLIQQFPREPESARALVLKGRIFEEAGRLVEAIRVYRRAVGEFPNYEAVAVSLWRLGWIAYLGGDLAGAGRQFGRLVDLPMGQAYRFGSLYWAGRSREALGEHGEARRLFRLLLAEAPRSYYGILAARRTRTVRETPGRPLPVQLPPDPLAPLAAEPRFVKAEALRTLGLTDHARAEIEELFASAFAEPLSLYGISALWVREEQYHLALRILRRHFADLAWGDYPALPRQFWEMFYPMGWRQELRQASERAGLDPHLLAAVVREESSFFPRARSKAGARGLMQLMPETARPLALRRGLAFGDGELLDEPGANLELGAEFLAKLFREFGDPRLALAAYNAGPVRVRKWWEARRSEDLEIFVEQIPFEETRHFVKRVLISWEEYQRVYGASR